MKRKFIYIGFMLAYTVVANAQWYYPLGLGNRWEFWDAFPPPQAYAWTTRIVGDTVMPNAMTYRVLRSDGGWLDQFQRQIGTIVYEYVPYLGRKEILFDFSRNVGDTVAISYRGLDTIVTTVTFDYYAQVFGRTLRVKEFYERSTRTSMYVIRSVVDSMGMLRMTYEPGMGGHAAGAIIDGVQYGTITTLPEKASQALASPVLQQNYPNPFNPSTTIRFSLSTSTFITLKVLNILGQEVATLAAGKRESGTHSETWHAANNPSGVYFYVLNMGHVVEVKQMVLMK